MPVVVRREDRSDGTRRNAFEQDHVYRCLSFGQKGEFMKTPKTANRNTTRTVGNDVRASGQNIIPLRGANGEKMKQDTPIQRLRPPLQAVVLTHDVIAERARAIWLERGCSPDQDEENWRDAEAQLKTEMGIG
jgi:hypothetical protein